MKLIISANLIIVDPEKDIVEKAISDLTIPNPKYYMNKSMGLWSNNEPENLELFTYSGSVLELPRGYDISGWLHRFSEIENRMTGIYQTLPLPDHASPMPFQLEAAEAFIKAQQGGVIAPCGAGKTEIAIVVVSRLKCPTLILVHKKELVDQWKDRFKQRLNYDAGIIAESRHDIKPITIATVQSLYSKNGSVKYTIDNFYRYFSMVILDEAHHAPARSWMVILSKCPAQYRLWLTATENRKDGLGPTIPLTCGKIVYRIEHRDLLKFDRIIIPEYVEHRLNFVEGSFAKNVFIDGKKTEIIDRHKLDYAIIHNDKRNDYICDQIAKDYISNRYILVITPKSIEHCEILADNLSRRYGIKSTLLVASGNNKVSSKDRQRILDDARNGRIRLIIATVIAEEGLDIPLLDTIHLAYPMTDCEQAVGRIMRACSTKNKAVVHDYIDVSQPYLLHRAMKRQRFFHKLNRR